jgi:uncharacterized membrane protein YhdT
MDAKYNSLMDDARWRIALNVTGFVVWFVLAYALLSVAA